MVEVEEAAGLQAWAEVTLQRFKGTILKVTFKSSYFPIFLNLISYTFYLRDF